MKKTTKLVLVSSVLILSLSGCGYQGGYRYSCQDPANWGAKDCVPPICKATGQCTTDLVGFDPTAKDSNTIDKSTTTSGGTNG